MEYIRLKQYFVKKKAFLLEKILARNHTDQKKTSENTSLYYNNLQYRKAGNMVKEEQKLL